MRGRGLLLAIGAATTGAMVGLAGLSRGQQPNAGAGEAPGEKVAVRARVVKLRAEIAWLELENEALVDRSRLRDLVKEVEEETSVIRGVALAEPDPATAMRVPAGEVDAR